MRGWNKEIAQPPPLLPARRRVPADGMDRQRGWFLLVAVGQFVHHAGPDPARGTGVDAYPVSRQIHSFITRELQDRRLSYGVKPASGLRHLGADAAKVDHGPATPLHHVWLRRLQHHDASHDVDVVAV